MCKSVSISFVCSVVPTVYDILDYWQILMCLIDEVSETNQEKLLEMEKSNDCPLCLEPLEFDDKNFFPCKCLYQICRFCWHRIRTNENGLCPACRRMYSEDPADFKPYTPEEIQKAKLQKKMNVLQKKQKVAESRKQLGNIRVIQKNLVFAVGLPLELSQDNEKKEKVLQMFRQFGSTQKEAITDRTSYAGSQGPSACVYITYQKPEEAVRAVKSLTNTKMEGRTIKVSLGTTKYCSNFLKNIQCPKTECLYLHELADEEASFTKEDIHLGKHLEYEQKLIEQTLQSISPNKMNSPNGETNQTNHNQNVDNCSECSDDIAQNGSFYDSSEASELSPSSNSQTLENNRSIESDLNVESEHNYQNVHSANSRSNPENTPSHSFRSEENLIVVNHASNSNFKNVSPNSVNTCYSNQMQQKDESVPQSNILHNQIYENTLKNRGQSNPNESVLFRMISTQSVPESDNSFPNILNLKQEHSQPKPRKRDDDPDLGFDPFAISLSALAEMCKQPEEKARIHYNAINRSSSYNKFGTVPPYSSGNVAVHTFAPQKVRDPPPGFSNSHQQNFIYKPAHDSGISYKPPVSITARQAVRTLQRFQQPGVNNSIALNNSPSLNNSIALNNSPSLNNSIFHNDYSHQLSRDVPEIHPSLYPQHSHQFMNVARAQIPHIEQRSNPPQWNNSTQSHWRPMENAAYFNQSMSENRVTNDISWRMQQLRANESPIRHWQMNGNMNNLSPYAEPQQQQPFTQEQLGKIQTLDYLYKTFEAQRNSGLGHRLQYTKKL